MGWEQVGGAAGRTAGERRSFGGARPMSTELSTPPAGDEIACAGYWSGSEFVADRLRRLDYAGVLQLGRGRLAEDVCLPGGQRRRCDVLAVQRSVTRTLQFTGCADIGPATFQGVDDNLASGQGPSTTTGTAAADNTVFLAFSWEFTSGGVTYTRADRDRRGNVRPRYEHAGPSAFSQLRDHPI